METINALGRRKAAVARVYVKEGAGKITINGRDMEVYFPSSILQYIVKQPLVKLDVAEKYDIKVNLDGGGYKGQAEALRLAIARALVKINPVSPKHVNTSSSVSVNNPNDGDTAAAVYPAVASFATKAALPAAKGQYIRRLWLSEEVEDIIINQKQTKQNENKF